MTRTPLVVTLGVALLAATGCQRQQSQPGVPSSPSSSGSSASSGRGIFQTILGVASGLMTSGGVKSPGSSLGSAGSSSGGMGMVDSVMRVFSGLAGSGGGYAGGPTSSPTFLGRTNGNSTAVPGGWQQSLGRTTGGYSRGGGALADPATTRVIPTGGVYRVIATSFWNQPVAGKTVEDGDGRLDDGERGMALPSRRGLGRWVAIRYNGRVAYAPVIDVGPIYTDDAYWEGDGVPRSVKNRGQRRTGPTNEVNGVMQRTGYTVNGQAADLTPATWRDLGVNTRQVKETIEWWFVDEATGIAGFQRQRAGGGMMA